MVTHPRMLTTMDNPFDPFTQYDEWEAFDHDRGYYTDALLARITITSDELSDTDQDEAIETAITEIISENTLGIYKAVTQS